MNTLLFLVVADLLTLFYSFTRVFEESKLRLSKKLRGMKLSHGRLFIYSRTIAILTLIDFILIYFFPKITLPKLIIVLLVFIFAIIHSLVYLFSMAAYDLLKK